MSDLGIDPVQLALYAMQQGRGDDSAKELNYLQDLMYSLGVDMSELLGQTPAPQEPEFEPLVAPVEPEYYTSDLIRSYTENPVLGGLMSALLEGADPLAQAQAAVNAAIQDPELVKYLPQVTRDSVGNQRRAGSDPEIDVYAVQQMFQDAGLEAARERRERDSAQAQYTQAQDLYTTQLAQQQAEQQAYDQYYAGQNEYALRGSPSVQDDIDMYLNRLGVTAQAPRYVPGAEEAARHEQAAALAGRFGFNLPERTPEPIDYGAYRDTIANADRVGVDMGRSKLGTSPAARAGVSSNDPGSYGGNLADGELSRAAQRYLEQRVAESQGAQQQNMSPSQFSRDKADRVLALMGLLGS